MDDVVNALLGLSLLYLQCDLINWMVLSANAENSIVVDEKDANVSDLVHCKYFQLLALSSRWVWMLKMEVLAMRAVRPLIRFQRGGRPPGPWWMPLLHASWSNGRW